MRHPVPDIKNAVEIQGWMSVQELEWLANTARDASIILEVGSYRGRSTRAMADNTDGVIYCIDPWSGIYPFDDGRDSGINTDVYGDFLHNLVDHIEDGTVIPIRGKFGEVKLDKSLRPDFIFLDGDHRYDNIKSDIKLAKKMLADNGILAGHDYGDSYWPGVKRAVDESVREFEVIGEIWIAKF